MPVESPGEVIHAPRRGQRRLGTGPQRPRIPPADLDIAHAEAGHRIPSPQGRANRERWDVNSSVAGTRWPGPAAPSRRRGEQRRREREEA